jgi:TetR/AcrR family transcriptional repressor of nem operon
MIRQGQPKGSSMRAMTGNGRSASTAQKILDVGERLIQVRGYNGFSYADIADALRVTKASLHYHFPSKAELGRCLMERYTENFVTTLAGLDAARSTAREKLHGYASIYSDVLANNRMCLCGMLAAEYATLPKSVKSEVTRFFDTNETWLADVLEQGRRAERFQIAGSPADAARRIIAALEGAMMLARVYAEPERFERAAQSLLAEVTGARSRMTRGRGRAAII